MNWFERHINWTIVLATVVFSLIVGLTRSLGGDIGAVILLLIAYGWALNEKGRSLWCLLWLVLGVIGIVILLVLENKNTDLWKMKEQEMDK